MSLSFVSEAPGELVAVDLTGGQDVRFTRKQQHSGGRATTLTLDSHARRKAEDWAEGRAFARWKPLAGKLLQSERSLPLELI
jgi:hypothetical protein